MEQILVEIPKERQGTVTLSERAIETIAIHLGEARCSFVIDNGHGSLLTCVGGGDMRAEIEKIKNELNEGGVYPYVANRTSQAILEYKQELAATYPLVAAAVDAMCRNLRDRFPKLSVEAAIGELFHLILSKADNPRDAVQVICALFPDEARWAVADMDKRGAETNSQSPKPRRRRGNSDGI